MAEAIRFFSLLRRPPPWKSGRARHKRNGKQSPSFHFAHNYTKIYHTCHEWRFEAEEQHTHKTALYWREIKWKNQARGIQEEMRKKKMNKHTAKWLHIVCWHVKMQIMATLLTTSTVLLLSEAEEWWSATHTHTQPLINNMFARCLSLVHKIISK